MKDDLAVLQFEEAAHVVVRREQNGENLKGEAKPLLLTYLRLVGNGIMPAQLAWDLLAKPTVAAKVAKFAAAEIERLAKDPLVPVLKVKRDGTSKVYLMHIATLWREAAQQVIHPTGRIRTEDEQRVYVAAAGGS